MKYRLGHHVVSRTRTCLLYITSDSLSQVPSPASDLGMRSHAKYVHRTTVPRVETLPLPIQWIESCLQAKVACRG
jgi:hypothetical protein